MNYKEISDLINTVSNSKLTSFEIEVDGIHIKMGKEEKSLVKSNTLEKTLENKSNRFVPNKEEKSLNDEGLDFSKESKTKESIIQDEETVEIIKSPIVGTFYSAPSPDKENFVKVGSTVKKGDTLCIIEAMKLMNEIESEFNGEVLEILVKNEDMVEYGQPLFKIKKA